MKLAMIGAGNVGATLGKRLRDLGHAVRWGVPDPSNTKYEGLEVAEVATAVAEADIVMLAVPWSAAEQAIKSAGNLRGKVLIDMTNPIAQDFSNLVDLSGSSAAEHVAQWAPGAFVVKAFNTIGNNIMENPLFDHDRASLLVASDNSEAKQVVMSLAEELGFDPIDAGPLAMARHLESFAWVWITLALKQGYGREIVFHLLRR
jgi:predicted dinucleotide-binding enzyme